MAPRSVEALWQSKCVVVVLAKELLHLEKPLKAFCRQLKFARGQHPLGKFQECGNAR